MLGINVTEPDSHNGEFSAHVPWRRMENYTMRYAEWFHSESQTPEVREILGHLNRAAKSMVDDVAQHQAKVVKNVAKAAKDFVQWVEPDHTCDSHQFASCLAAENRTFTSAPPTEAFMGQCARDSNCSLNFDGQVRTHHIRKAMKHAHHAKRALKHMARDVERSFVGEMRSQMENVEKVQRSFLNNARKTLIDWGCDRKCVVYNTGNMGRLGDMSMCGCPANMTITGDTSIFM